MAKIPCALVLAVLVSSALAVSNEEFADRLTKLSKRYPPEIRSSEARAYTPGLPGGFKCAILPPSSTIPTDARRVRFADIKVVAALGDSITAANGVLAWTVPGVLKQYRGLSWSVGGDKDITKVLTLPNILKKYNPQLYGYSLGSSYSEDTTDAYYNVASAGDTAIELVAQSVKLVDKILKDKRESQWKLITIFIGGNDVCEYCNFPDTLSPESYKRNIISVLQNLYAALPNTIVNLASPIDLTQVTTLPDGFGCKAVHNGVCGCAYNKDDPDYATRMSRAYQQKIEEIVSEAPTHFPRENFGIAYQPQFKSGNLPQVDGKPDLSYFAPDCFHLSQIGHEHSAITLWNNMQRPAAERSQDLQMYDRSIICPTEASPYIQI